MDNEKQFLSKYHIGNISSAQYLVELVCERMARKDRVELTPQFWNSPHWKKIYRYQIISANRLLKMFRVEAIIAALREKKTIYSLGCKWLDPVIKEQQIKLERKEQTLSKENDMVDKEDEVKNIVSEQPRKPFSTHNPLDALRNLDD